MYGRSEAVLGGLTEKLRLGNLFIATKVWTSGRPQGIAQIDESRRLLHRSTLDLVQVHNLLDADTQLETLRRQKAEGRIRYVGVSHYTPGAYGEIARLLSTERIDFLQINYSVLEREAEERLLPLAADRGVAVIANRPFAGGDAFRRTGGRPLPAWAAEIDCVSWGELFLKWILAHPAVTCVIPATDKLRHLEDNMRAGLGRLPDAGERRRIEALVSAT